MGYFTIAPRAGRYIEPPRTAYHNTYAVMHMVYDRQRPVPLHGMDLSGLTNNLTDPGSDYSNMLTYLESDPALLQGGETFKGYDDVEMKYYYTVGEEDQGIQCGVVNLKATAQVEASCQVKIPKVLEHQKDILEFVLTYEHGLPGRLLGYKTMLIEERIFPSMRRLSNMPGERHSQIHFDQNLGDTPEAIKHVYLIWSGFPPSYPISPLDPPREGIARLGSSLPPEDIYRPDGNGVFHNGTMNHFATTPKLMKRGFGKKPRVLLVVEFDADERALISDEFHKAMRENTIEQTRRLAENPQRRLRTIGLETARPRVTA